MNKLLTKIVGVVLGTTMAVGVGVGVAVNNNRGVVDSQVNAAVGTDSKTVTMTSNSVTNDGVTWALNSISDYASSNSYIRFGSGTYIQNSSAIVVDKSYQVQFEVTTRKYGGPSDNQIVLTVDVVDSSGASMTTGSATVQPSGTSLAKKTSSALTFSTASGSEGVFFRIKSSDSATSSKCAGVSVITVKYKAGSSCAHDWSEWETKTVATCDTKGEETRECSICHEIETREIDSLGHDWVAGTIHAPTCTKDGYTEYECSRCQEEKHDDVVEALGHNYVDGVCTRCGEEKPTVVGTYSKVTDLDQLVNGATVIITNEDGTNAMGSQNTNNRAKVTGASSANGTISISNDSTSIQVFTIEDYSTQEDTIVAFKTLNPLNDVDGYLYAAGSGSNYLKTQETVDKDAKFYITLSSGDFTVVASDSSNRNDMRYNSSNNPPIFSCYASTSTQPGVALYIKDSSTPAPTTYTVTYDANGGEGTMTDSNSPYSASSTVTTLNNTFTRDGYTFAHWSTATDGTGTDYDQGATFTMTADTTLYAIWDQNGGGTPTAARCYHLVESTSDLIAGAKYIITNESNHANGFYALSTNQKSSNRGAASVTAKESVASVTTTDVDVVTLGGSAGAWTFSVTNGYLYAASSSGNQLKTQKENDKNGQWAITISDGVASIIAQGTNTRNVMQYNYNGGSPLFACYASASQSAVCLYRLDFSETLLHNVVCDGDGSHALPEGYTWNIDLKGVYDDLPLAEQNSLKTASNAGLERYDYIIGKYNPTGSEQSDYKNFIGRKINPLTAPRISANTTSSTAVTTTVVIISVISLSTLCGYFLLRKRKEQ